MERPCLHIDVDRRGEVFCVRLRQSRLDEAGVYEVGDELLRLIDEHGCRKLALSLGPEPLECLYSVFLARLVTVRRKLLERGGALVLCEVSPESMDVFEAARLENYFTFAPDRKGAVAALTS